MTGHHDLLSQAHGMILGIAPELGQQQLYLIDAREYPELRADRCYAWAGMSRVFDPGVRDILGSRYEGPGNVVLLDVESIRADANPDGFEMALLSTMLHEAGHLLPAFQVREPKLDSPEIRKEFRGYLCQDLPKLAASKPAPGRGDPKHDLRFLRRVCHLGDRAKAAGYAVSLKDALMVPLTYCHPAGYLEFLRGELDTMAGATFAEIEAMSLPDELEARWADDMAYQRAIEGGRLREYLAAREATATEGERS